MKVAPALRPALFDDYDRIRTLGKRHKLVTKTYDEWRHLWADNPVYKRSPNWPIGWVLEQGDEIVGYLGNIPLAYHYRHRQLVVAASHAFMVDTDFRNYSLSLLGQYYKQRDVHIFLNTTANSQASPAYRLFRATPIPVGRWDQSAFWISNYCGFMASLLQRKRFPLRRIFAVPFASVLRVRDAVGACRRHKCRSVLEIHTHRLFDERFDVFWRDLQSKRPDRLLADRSCETLNWHFKYMLLQDEAWIVTAESCSSLVAYGIFCRQDNPNVGLKRVRIVDFQALNGDAELLLPILAQALEQCRGDGIHMLEALGFAHDKQTALNALRPHWRVLPSWLYYYKATDGDLMEALKNPEVWDPSCLDGDSSL